jgi:hypothetical protein
MRSWDRFAVPKPYSRARAVVSGRIQIPQNLDRDGIEHYRVKMELLLNRLTDEAGAWAESGTRKVGQVACRRQAGPIGKRMELPMSYAMRDEDTPPTIALPRRVAG